MLMRYPLLQVLSVQYIVMYRQNIVQQISRTNLSWILNFYTPWLTTPPTPFHPATGNCSIGGVTHRLSFYDLITTFYMLSGFTQVVSTAGFFFFFDTEWCALCVYPLFITHSPIHKHLDSFHILITVNSAAVNIEYKLLFKMLISTLG